MLRNEVTHGWLSTGFDSGSLWAESSTFREVVKKTSTKTSPPNVKIIGWNCQHFNLIVGRMRWVVLISVLSRRVGDTRRMERSKLSKSSIDSIGLRTSYSEVRLPPGSWVGAQRADYHPCPFLASKLVTLKHGLSKDTFFAMGRICSWVRLEEWWRKVRFSENVLNKAYFDDVPWGIPGDSKRIVELTVVGATKAG